MNFKTRSRVFLILLFACLLCQSCGEPSEILINYEDIDGFVLIEKDLAFTMGCQENLGCICVHRDVIPPFAAILSPYYIGKYEVRNDEFAFFVSDSGYKDSTFWSIDGWEYIVETHRTRPANWIEGDDPWQDCPRSNTPDRPINNISWYEAEAYCSWLSRETGDNYALPTEAQWERAARGPDPGRVFTYGNEHDSTKYNNMGYSRKLYPVGRFTEDVSVDGCFDMAGNLLEFCSDWYDVEIYQQYKDVEPVYNPSGPANNLSGARSVRGLINLFHYDWEIEKQIQTITRANLDPDTIENMQGFRVTINI